MSEKKERAVPRARSRFDGIGDLFSEVNRIRALGVHGGEVLVEQLERTYVSAWVPSTDILAIGDDLVIRVELPGVRPADVDLRLTRDVLTVSGVRTDEDAGEAAYLTRERYHGEFRRSFALPEGTEPAQVSAEFADGLVTITVRGCVGVIDGTRICVQDRSEATPTRVLGERSHPNNETK